MSNSNQPNLKGFPPQKRGETSNSKEEPFFMPERVKHCKNQSLKIRLQTIIQSQGKSEPEFYNGLGISRQYWYFISWGIWDAPLDLKLKIARALNIDSALIFQEALE